MIEMSEWARELAAEVEAAAPNAPAPVYGTGEDAEGLTWRHELRGILLHAQREGGEESWWRAVPRKFPARGIGLEFFFVPLDASKLGQPPRAHFVRLVAEMWP